MVEVGERFFRMFDEDIAEEFKKHEPNYGICVCGAQACAAHETLIEALHRGRVYLNRTPFAVAHTTVGFLTQVKKKFPQDKYLWKLQEGILYVFPK